MGALDMARAKLRVLRVGRPDIWPTDYKLGMWAAVLHRLTGLYLIGYLSFHLFEMALSLFGPAAFDKFFGWGYTWWMQVLDLGLMAALLYHGMNGLRIILHDLGIGVRRHKLAFGAAMLVAAGAYAFLARDILHFMMRWQTL